MGLTPDDVRSLVAAFEASDWDELSVRIEDTTLELTRSGLPPVNSAGTPPAAPVQGSRRAHPMSPNPEVAPPVVAPPVTGQQPGATDGYQVTAPSLGLFWRSPQPGAPPFVEIGQVIDGEDTVCIIEVMKLMHHVKAVVGGTVIAIVPENGQMVEFGQLLVVIQPPG